MKFRIIPPYITALSDFLSKWHSRSRQGLPQEPAFLDLKQPPFVAAARQIDQASAFVRAMEELLNRPGIFCTETVLKWFQRGIEGQGLVTTSAFALGAKRIHDSWRIVLLRWEGDESVGPRREPEIKPWLESGLFERAMTLSKLGELYDKLVERARMLADVATENEHALASFEERYRLPPPK